MTVQQRMDKNDRGDEIRWTVGVIVALPIILLAIRGLTWLDIICKLPPLVRVGIGIAVGIFLVLLDLHIVVLGVASALFLAAWEVGVALWDVATTMPTVVPTPTTATPNRILSESYLSTIRCKSQLL